MTRNPRVLASSQVVRASGQGYGLHPKEPLFPTHEHSVPQAQGSISKNLSSRHTNIPSHRLKGRFLRTSLPDTRTFRPTGSRVDFSHAPRVAADRSSPTAMGAAAQRECTVLRDGTVATTHAPPLVVVAVGGDRSSGWVEHRPRSQPATPGETGPWVAGTAALFPADSASRRLARPRRRCGS